MSCVVDRVTVLVVSFVGVCGCVGVLLLLLFWRCLRDCSTAFALIQFVHLSGSLSCLDSQLPHNGAVTVQADLQRWLDFCVRAYANALVVRGF